MQDFTYNFFLKVQVTEGCWLWKSTINRDGYGTYKKTFLMDSILAHRLSYRIFKGDFERSLLVCHHCDNPRCVNPNHLFLGTVSDNMRDCVKKGRHYTFFKKSEFCKKGHLFNDETTYIKPTDGRRYCKICQKDTRLKNKLKRAIAITKEK